MMRSLSEATSIVGLGVAALVVGLAGFASAQQPRRALPRAPGVLAFAQRGQEEASSGLALPRAPRELRRALSRAQRAIDDGRYTDAVELLSEILQAPDGEDYFLPSIDDRGLRSLKTAARDLLGGLPEEGREIYELQAGSTARRLLNEAIEQRSFEALNEVGRRYFHTIAGYQATYLMGRYCLDQDWPVAAAIHFQRLRDVGKASYDFEPDLSFYLATSWKLAHNDPAALEALEYLQQRFPGVRLDVGGKVMTVPKTRENAVIWLNSILDDLPEAVVPMRLAWLMFRGDPSRNAEFDGDAPIPKLEWSVPATAMSEYSVLVEREMRKMTSNGQPPITAFHPLAVGDTVLMRTPHMLLGVDLNSGKRIWPYPWDTPEIDETSLVNHPYALHTNPVEDFVRQRMWEDGVNGQMSCSESTVFLLHDLKPLGSLVDKGPQFNLIRRGAVSVPDALKDTANQLVALDIDSDGKIRWIVGGKDGESDELAGAFFLGAPLPLGDQLFVLTERQDEIRLCVLDAATGRLQWAQQIAQVESPFAWYLDAVRRLCGCSPAYADGILVCTTGSGLVVGIDVDSRSLLWSYEYRRDSIQSSRPMQFRQMSRAALPEYGKRWTDNGALIASGQVLLTPVDSNLLHCIDLLSGEKRWTKKRGDYLYLAGVHEDVVVLVGKHKVQGVGLADGKAKWSEPLDIPSRAMPSGHGFLADDVLHVPTTAEQLLRIRVTDGRLLEQIPTDGVLGNLIGHGDYIISQAATGLKAFLRRDRARSIVERRLKERPDDAETWETHASLLLGDGLVEEAIASLRRAAELAGASDLGLEIREDLVELLLHELEGRNASVALDEIERLATSRTQRKRLYRIRFERARDEGQLREAIQHVMSRWEIVATGAQELREPLVPCDDTWQVNERVWLRQQFEALLDELSPEDRKVTQDQLLAQASATVLAADIDERHAWLDALPGFTKADDANETDDLLVDGRFLEVQLRLLPLVHSDDDAARGEALVQLARLYKITGSPQLALDALRRLASLPTEARDDYDPDTLMQEVRSWSGAAHDGLPSYENWPVGAVEFETVQAAGGQVRAPMPVAVHPVAGWPAGWTLAYDYQDNQLTIRDELGGLVRVARLPEQVKTRRQFPTYARVYGQLIVVNAGGMIVAIDAIGEKYDHRNGILWFSGDTKLFPESQQPEARQTYSRNRTSPFGVHVRSAGPANLGPVSPYGICFMHNGVLRCVEPLTGETLWKRDGIINAGAQNARRIVEVYGDAEHVFVQLSTESQARVFRTLDGSDLGTVEVPPINNLWTRQGRTLLTWDQKLASKSLSLAGLDPLSGRVWEKEFPKNTQGALLGNDEVVTLTPQGELEIRRINDGELVVQTTLPIKNLFNGALQVSRSTDDYLVIVSDQRRVRPITADGRSISIQPAMNAGPRSTILISGKAWAIDRTTGELVWDSPVDIRDFYLPEYQPAGAPWLVFMRKTITNDKRQKNTRTPTEQRVALAMLDRRDGEVVFLKQDLTLSMRMFTMEANWNARAVSIQVAPTSRVRLSITEADRLPSSRALPRVEFRPTSDENGIAEDDLDVEVEVPQ